MVAAMQIAARTLVAEQQSQFIVISLRRPWIASPPSTESALWVRTLGDAEAETMRWIWS